jgi:hypothetical protein
MPASQPKLRPQGRFGCLGVCAVDEAEHAVVAVATAVHAGTGIVQGIGNVDHHADEIPHTDSDNGDQGKISAGGTGKLFAAEARLHGLNFASVHSEGDRCSMQFYQKDGDIIALQPGEDLCDTGAALGTATGNDHKVGKITYGANVVDPAFTLERLGTCMNCVTVGGHVGCLGGESL